MATWTLTRSTDGEWHEYELCCEDAPMAYARWRQHGENAELHNDVLEGSKTVLVKIREAFTDIKRDMAKAGCKVVVVLSDRYDDKMGRYWRFMGFKYFAVEHGVHGAAMGVDDGG